MNAMNVNDFESAFSSLFSGMLISIVSRSFGHDKAETVTVVEISRRPHPWGGNYPDDRIVRLSDGTFLRPASSMDGKTERVSRWTNPVCGSPLARIISIEA